MGITEELMISQQYLTPMPDGVRKAILDKCEEIVKSLKIVFFQRSITERFILTIRIHKNGRRVCVGVTPDYLFIEDIIKIQLSNPDVFNIFRDKLKSMVDSGMSVY